VSPFRAGNPWPRTIGARPQTARRKTGQTVVPGTLAVTSAAGAAIVFPAPPRADVLRCWARTPRGLGAVGRPSPLPEDRGCRCEGR
jgi:hypothetical protein